jgi:serine/threonine-protein kinase
MAHDTGPRGDDASTADLVLRIAPIEVRLTAKPLEEIVRTTHFDAIVSSDDSRLSMSGGVSAIIGRLAGAAVRDEVASRLPLRVGEIAVTSAGTLRTVKYVIHAVTADWDNGVVATPRTGRQLAREILSRCEALGVARLAIPALGTGAAGLSPLVSARVIAAALRAHALNPTTLRLVVLPIPDPVVRLSFHTELDLAVRDETTSTPQVRLAARASGSVERQRQAAQDAGDAEKSWVRRWLLGDEVSRADDRTTLGSTRPGGAATRVTTTLVSDSSSRPLLNQRYVLLEEIGRGGMAVVYLAWDLVLRRSVAVKILRPDTVDQDALRREAAAAIELAHDDIVRVHHFEPPSSRGTGYLVMEYVPWPSGEKWIAEAGLGLLPVQSVVDVGAHISRALAHAHSRSFLHLDIKPSNVFVDPAGENAKLADFGLARISNIDGRALQLRPSGTPAYMAPEQQKVGSKVTSATDVYQLAATLWDFLTATPPRSPDQDVDNFEPSRRIVLGVLRDALSADPGRRPTAAALGERVVASAAAL